MMRKACVSGRFYPGNPDQLRKAVEGYTKRLKKEKAVAVISPHAGYMYSGRVAGCVFSSVEIPDAVVLIGPNHTGLGESASVMTAGEWETPMGMVEINEPLAELILHSASGAGVFSSDELAHLGEHSLEVELPFICLHNPDAAIVPVTVMPTAWTECEMMGHALAEAIRSYKKDVLIVVSSDMNHYESDRVTREKDKLAIDRVLKLDARGLIEITQDRNITMCGVVPAAIGIVAARLLNARKAELVDYATSGDSSGDYDHVVGYAGIVIK
ncbi:MAG: AmmeMemoRadiSam system protein B [Deltaproteobacteria bacterium]|nr:AmmeMemoRadiSam system protein B [Deltaproteobacteria bacterium]